VIPADQGIKGPSKRFAGNQLVVEEGTPRDSPVNNNASTAQLDFSPPTSPKGNTKSFKIPVTRPSLDTIPVPRGLSYSSKSHTHICIKNVYYICMYACMYMKLYIYVL
jgi:hypothetical protein